MENFQVLGIVAGAAIASPLGGLVSLWRAPSTLFTSVAVGYAGGVLLGSISAEMMPKAVAMGSIAAAIAGFLIGVAAIFALDLFIHRGKLAGAKADEHATVQRFHARRRPWGNKITVLAAGTSAEELIEGLSIGIGAAIDPSLGLVVGLSVAVDNFSEALSIGSLIRSEKAADRQPWLRTLGWTGLIGVSLFSSAMVGWLLLSHLSQGVLGVLFAVGAGGMFYLTVTDLIPEAEERHYQQSAGLAAAAGFATIFVLSALT
jgi:ZIP family zinc transporter